MPISIVVKRQYPRGEADNTATFAAGAVATFNAVGQKWPALDFWRSDTIRNKRIILDARLVPPPDDTAWIRQAANLFTLQGQKWPAIDTWNQAGRTWAAPDGAQPIARRPDPRRIPPPDDTPWIRQASNLFNIIGQQFPSIDTWTQRGVVTRARLPGPQPKGWWDDGSWITTAAPPAYSISDWPAIDAWTQQGVFIRPRPPGPQPRVYWDDGSWWIQGASAQYWPAIDTWSRQWMRTFTRPPGPQPQDYWDDGSWSAAANGIVFTPSLWPAIDLWTQQGVVTRARRPGPQPWGWWDDGSWIESAAVAQYWPAMDAWTQRITVPPARLRMQPQDYWDDGSWMETAATPTSAYTPAMWSALDQWTRATRVWRRVSFHATGVGVSGGAGIPFDATIVLAAIDSWWQASRTRKSTARFPDQGDDWSFAVSATDVSGFFASSIDPWRSDMVRRGRWLDPRLVAPPDDTAWIRTAAAAAAAIGLIWPVIEWARLERTRPKLILDPRRVPPPDDTPWIRQAANLFTIIGQQWPAIDAWNLWTTRGRPVLDPRRVPPPDDTSWIQGSLAGVLATAQLWPAIEWWLRAERTRKAIQSADRPWLIDWSWIAPNLPPPAPPFTVSEWPAILTWLQAERTRRGAFLDPRQVPPPVDTGWMGIIHTPPGPPTPGPPVTPPVTPPVLPPGSVIIQTITVLE